MCAPTMINFDQRLLELWWKIFWLTFWDTVYELNCHATERVMYICSMFILTFLSSLSNVKSCHMLRWMCSSHFDKIYLLTYLLTSRSTSVRDEESGWPVRWLHVKRPWWQSWSMRIASFTTVDLLDDVRIRDMQLPLAAPFLSKHLPVLAM